MSPSVHASILFDVRRRLSNCRERFPYILLPKSSPKSSYLGKFLEKIFLWQNYAKISKILKRHFFVSPPVLFYETSRSERKHTW